MLCESLIYLWIVHAVHFIGLGGAGLIEANGVTVAKACAM
jgi:bacteriorhodopsin